MDENYLIYEQEEVQLLNQEEEAVHIGKLRIIEKAGIPVIEWLPTLDDTSDGDWAVISSPNVAFSNKKMTDSVSFNSCKKHVSTLSIKVEENLFCRVAEDRKKLDVLNKEGEPLGIFIFHNQHVDFFFDVLRRYVTLREQDNDPTLYVLQNKHQADIDDKLSAMNLVSRKGNSRGQPKYLHGNSHHHWASEAPKKVWGFIHNMKRDPYTTTLSTFSKVYDIVLYGDIHEHISAKEDDEGVRELLQSISGIDDLEPGYEILTKREQLAERPEIDRLSPLSYEEYKTFVDVDGRIAQVKALRERIFRGGIHPNLRSELWCYLLGLYEWNSTHAEKEERRRAKEHEYFVMKQQWKTISADQERNFSGFRDRKSIIEKDVNRTDRNHPFYEGETNSNLEMLNDILMTYIMYNFDLGYVQGMSDLLAPILYVIQNEAVAFWCFVGYMERVHRNFDLDQSGMKQQLGDLSQVLRIVDPEFVSFLEAQDSANLYFCFRWLLVRFKRELNYADTLRLWEVLWTEHLSKNFHLCVATAILETEKDEIVEQKFSFTDVLKHINGLSLHIDLESALKKAEAIYVQLSRSPSVPNSVRTILNLPYIQKSKSPKMSPASECPKGGLPGHAERVTSSDQDGASVLGSVTTAIGSAVHHLATVGTMQTEEETAFEDAVSHSFL